MPSQNPDTTRWFAEEVQPHERSLRAYFAASAPTTVEVDDLVQDSYLRLFRARESGSIRCVRALLFAIARNAVRDAVRHKLSNREFPSTEIESMPVLDAVDVVDLVHTRQERMLLAEAIGALPQRCREVLLLRKIHGLSQREIAGRLGISENTVESLVSRGVRRCAHHVRRQMTARERNHA